MTEPEFIEAFGRLVSEGGLPPSIGRVAGLLVISKPRKLSAKEIQDRLRLSTGAVSAATSLLAKLGYIKRTTLPGQRRHYYEFEAGSWQDAINLRLAQLQHGIELAEQGLRLRQGDPRLTGMRSMYLQLHRAIKGVRVRL